VNRDELTRLKIQRATGLAPVPASKRRPFRAWAWLAGLLVVSYVAYAMLGEKAVEVDIGTVGTLYPAQAYTLLNASGYVVPQTRADVASKATGRLERLEVEEGSRVTRGQIIARIENQDVVANLHQAEANVAVAQTRLKRAEAELRVARLALNRARALAARKFISPDLVDAEIAREAKAAAEVGSAQAEIAAAEAAYDGAKVAVEYTLIRAPFDGVILEKHADLGDILAPFSSTALSKGSVVSMADLDTLKVEADVSESSLAKVSLGQPCEIQLDALPDTRFSGVVDQIVPTVDRTKATVMVKVRFVEKDSRVLPDMSAKVAFLSRALSPEERRPVTAVLASALAPEAGREAVFTVADGRARLTPVKTRGRLGDFVVIGEGVKTGDAIVTRPPPGLADGARVRAPK
jgi:RND family efflux transporter MFP subunit